MGLLYWLPMTDGTLINKGLSNIQPTNQGAIVNSNGKLGKCYDFAGSTTSYINSGFKESFGTGDFSIAAWFKLTDSGSRTYQPIISNKATAAASLGCAIYYNHSQQKFLWSTADGSGATEIWTSKQVLYNDLLNSWHHIVMIRNNSDAKKGYFYIDGERYELASVPAIRNVTNTTYSMFIGQIIAPTTNYGWTGSLCDIRIYDNALSANEVKKISQGLILHYPLSDGVGGENICKVWDVSLSGSDYGAYSTRTYDTTTHIGKIQVTSTSNRWNAWRFGTSDLDTPCTTLTTGTNTYTMSVDIKVTNYTSGTIVCGFDFRTNNIVSSVATVTLTAEQCNGKWHRVSSSLTTNNQQNTACLWCINSNNTIHGSQTTIEYKNWKLERGDKATPWIPNKSNSDYSKIGLNSNIAYDVSGYGNNGTKSGTIGYSSDTPRYNTSTFLNGSAYINTLADTFNWFDFSSCTISVWMKPTTTPSGYSGSVGIAHDSNQTKRQFSISNHGGVFVAYYNNGSYSNVSSGYTLPVNEWHHYVATLNGTTVKLYVDGVLKKTQTIDWGTATYGSSQRVQVGVDFPGTDEKYIGYYSDVRIYTTALSADDILELYKTPSYLASNAS